MHERIRSQFTPHDGQCARWNRKGQKYCGSFRGKKTYRNSNFYRAQRRMDGQDLYGTQIHAEFSAPGHYTVPESNNDLYDNKGNVDRGRELERE